MVGKLGFRIQTRLAFISVVGHPNILEKQWTNLLERRSVFIDTSNKKVNLIKHEEEEVKVKQEKKNESEEEGSHNADWMALRY